MSCETFELHLGILHSFPLESQPFFVCLLHSLSDDGDPSPNGNGGTKALPHIILDRSDAAFQFQVCTTKKI